MTAPTDLRTERLVLRPFQEGDVADALAYRNDSEFARFLVHIPQPFTIEDARAFVAQNMSEPWERSPTFAIVLDGKLIGTVNLEVDAEKREAMLGYAIGRQWWGQGIATEAARAAMAWAVDAFELARIWASTDTRNLRSLRVLEKLGMKRESVRVGDHVGREGELVDEVVYGVGFPAAMTETDSPPVHVVPYDDAWPGRFREEYAVLAQLVAPYLLGPIEHIGSTAIPGLVAKPTIDIMVGVSTLAESLPLIPLLAERGYTHLEYNADVMHWFCKPSLAVRTYHLHAVPVGSPLWRDRLAFRNYLRAHPDVAAEYAALKLELAERHRLDREAYTDEKGPFVHRVLELAR